ncbi:unnamed protein product [[Candida] boidinii]|uniref:Unnamed protein product n=1 Tax=Candida boidinii TaxID=5477 RepID=A0A9W6SX94_CANBO|nr:hypothetical protein B5S30_g5306 [[Candida] boidinii]OWB86854.1 hypothetical protein B5S33_g5573 [[Candida] boidinii]GME68416.1 unnamed protein product [[Candida] boidinii]GMG00220.1 unnamed protein product [[Candida] boidinii]
MSRATQQETDNDNQFHILANKISQIRLGTEDIFQQTQQESSLLDSLGDNMGNLMTGLRGTASNLTRVMNANPHVSRLVLLGLIGFFIIWSLYKLL